MIDAINIKIPNNKNSILTPKLQLVTNMTAVKKITIRINNSYKILSHNGSIYFNKCNILFFFKKNLIDFYCEICYTYTFVH